MMTFVSLRRGAPATYAALAAGLLALLPAPLLAASQAHYATPEAAVAALETALKAGNAKALLAIFGDDATALVSTGDPTTDRERYAVALARLQQYHSLDAPSPDRRILALGDRAWPFPIPLVKDKSGWRFATEEGEQELINRRIGAGELDALTALAAYPDAQDQYAEVDRDGDGLREYAMKLASTPGKHDGLYWPDSDDAGQGRSPFGPLIAQSGIDVATHQPGAPFNGYYFKILTAQGPAAPAGAYNYVVNGHLLGGYALLAWPSAYGNTGIMTFIVSRNGKIYQRDLGDKTDTLAPAIASFDPGPGWTEVTDVTSWRETPER